MNGINFFKRSVSIVFVAMAFSGCNNQGTSAGSADSTVTSQYTTPKTITSFSELNIRRFPIPIRRLDSLKKLSLTVKDYLSRTRQYEYLISMLQTDTVLPPRIKLQEIRRSRSLLEDLKNLASMKKVESQCGMIDGTTDILTYKDNLFVPRSFVVNQASPIGMLQWNKSFGNTFKDSGDDEGDVFGQPRGSGCLIDLDLFITAGHCFSSKLPGTYPPKKNKRDLSPTEMAPLMNVVFNFESISVNNDLVSDSVSFPVVSLVDLGDKLDYAIVRLGPRNGKKAGELFGWLKTVSSDYINHTDTLCIIQHPQGKAKRVECGPLLKYDDSFLYYNKIDTYGGSSGAPVINYSSGLLEGVHFDGDCFTEQGTVIGSNKAVRIQAIKKVSHVLKD